MKTFSDFTTEQEEHLLRMRRFLARAVECAGIGDIETADAFVALAANKLAGVVARGNRIFTLTNPERN